MTHPTTKKLASIVQDSFFPENGATPKPRIRFAFHPAVHVKFDADTMFHSVWETSNFFEMFLPEGVGYIEVSIPATEDEKQLDKRIAWFENIARHGMKHEGKTYRMIFGDWDDDGVAILVPVDSGIKSLADVNLSLTINKDSDKAKVRKYFRRVRAHHEWAVKGEVYNTLDAKHGTNLHVLFENGENRVMADVLHVDLETLGNKLNIALADGIHLIDVEFCHQLGAMFGILRLLEAKVGDAFKGTSLGESGLGKGFFHVVENSAYNVIVFGPKKQAKLKDFFLGSLGDVKGGPAYTDLQSMINFDYHLNGLAHGQGVKFIEEIVASIHNEKKLRHLFLTHIDAIADVLGKESETGRENWVLLEALRKGVSIRKNPGLFRRVVRHLLTHVLDATKGRVPYMDVAQRFNLMPDLNCFVNSEGQYDGSVDYRRSSIPADAVVCMDLNQGPFAMYRQPSGHKRELVFSTNIHDRRFRRFRGLNRVILGPSAYYQLMVMGGGDMDDAVVATDNLEWIEIMVTGDYPVTPLPAADPIKDLDSNNKYRRGSKYPRQWSMQDFFDAVAKAKEIGLSIGVVVNAIMLDELLSGEHKENMLSFLADQLADATTEKEKEVYRKAYDWLRARKDRQLRVVASNLEQFIDMDKVGADAALAALLAGYIEQINDVRSNSMVIPECFLLKRVRGGKETCRIPDYRLAEMDFVTAPSLVCSTLNQLKHEVDLLTEALVEEQWLNVDLLPESLTAAFPVDQALRDVAIEQRNDWREAFQNRGTAKLEDAYQIILATVVRPGFHNNELEFSEEEKVQLAVEHARLTYRGRKTEAQRNPDGSRRSYPDGLLWTNCIGMYYIQALEEAGLTGLYVPVTFDRWSRKYARGNHNVDVILGVVTLHEDGTTLGTTMGDVVVEDGTYTMEDGMITVMEPSDELHRDSTKVDEEFGNPVDLDGDSDYAFGELATK
jgi:hypothetical protein